MTVHPIRSADTAGPAAVRAPSTSAFRFLSGYVARRPWQFGALLVLVTGAAICAVAVQYGMKLIVDTMSTGDRSTPQIWRWLALFIGLIATESLLWRCGGWLGCKAIVATGVDMRLDLFEHLAGHPMQYFNRHFSGALGNRITATAGATGSVLGTLIWKILPPVVDFLGAVVVLATVDWRMALALVLFVSVLSTGVLLVGLRGKPLHQAFAERGAAVNGDLVDVVANIWTVKAFAAASREHRRLQAAFTGEAAAQQRSWLYLEKTRVLHDVFLCIMAGSMLIWAIVAWRHGLGTSGDVVVVSALTFRILHGSRDLALALVDAAQQYGVIAEMLGVVAVRHQVADAPSARPFTPRGGSIQLVDVTFGYEPTIPVLRRLRLHVPAGQRCGVVGPSGAGKSTLLGLMQRLDDVQSGAVLVDGQDVRLVQQDSLRRAMAVVPQDMALLHRSVMDNIRYGRPDASDDEVRQAARAAGCDEFILALPSGYDTLVGERGARLSGGQRQRIGIARAFLKEAPILLLDEATSALDSESERGIQSALKRLMRGRTVIAVAHRLSTVDDFDRVVVLDRGVVVEDGTPQALRCAGGLYARLWRLQAAEEATA